MQDQKFWVIDTPAEERIVNELIERRYPGLVNVLSRALETADPLDIVYPSNPNEYSDVVKEIVVLMESYRSRTNPLSRSVIYDITRRAIDRCFGEPPDEMRVHSAVDSIMNDLEFPSANGVDD